MIEQLQGFPDNVLAFACHGQVTRGDYLDVLVPAVTRALKTHGKLRLYYETAADFTGFDPGAMWEDFKVGIEHVTRWERVAVVTDVDWIKRSAGFFNLLIPATVNVFATSQAAQARQWLAS